MNRRLTLFNKPCLDFYNSLVKTMLDANHRQFFIAYRDWLQGLKEKKNPKLRIRRLLSKLK
jgi:hypothetical protein